MSAALDYKRKIYEIRDLPTLPVIAQKILCLADDDETGAERLSKIISSDPALAAKVLRLANSAYYGHRAKISTIQHAIVVIGLNMLRQLSVGVIVFNSVKPDRHSHKEFWKHSIKTGTAASMIAQRARVESPEVCFVGGLLHDIGRLILETHLPDEYRQVHRLVESERLPLFLAERRTLETDHAEVGAWVAQRWQLPQQLVAAIAHHHDTLIQPRPEAGIIAAVNAANVCAAMTEKQFSDENEDENENEVEAVSPSVAEILKLTQADFQNVAADLQKRKWEIDQFLI